MSDLASRMAEAGLSSPMLRENRADPYPAYAFIREHEPVHRAPDGTWVLTRYDHAAAVIRDPRFGTNPAHLADDTDMSTQSPVRQVGSSLMMFLDPPDHTRLRSLVSQAFTPRVVEDLRPRIVGLVNEQLDAVIERGDGVFDVFADLAYPLPTVVICELLGVPAEDHHQFQAWSAGASRLLDSYLDQASMLEAMTSGMELFRYFTDLVEERRARPGDDLLSRLIGASLGPAEGPALEQGLSSPAVAGPEAPKQALERGDSLSHAELLSTVTLLFVAGFETTMNLVANGLLALLRHPDELARLRDDPTLVRTGVEELLRYDGPVHVTARIATTDVEIGGRLIGKGEQGAVSLGAANRDPDQFPDPDRLDVGRTPNRHLALGGGPHYCLGAALARIEGQVAFEAILRRLPGVELATERPAYRDHFVIRGLTELKLRFRT